jgi:hypothetical protein
MTVQPEITLIVQTRFIVFVVVRRDPELVELWAQIEGEVRAAAEILQVLGPDPEVLTDVDGYQAPGGRGKEIAAREVEDGADAAELVVVETDLGKGQGVFLDLEIDPAAAVGKRDRFLAV